MERLRIYIDTSVLGGCFDQEFAVWSNGLVRDFRAVRFVPVLSDVTAAEVQDAPEPVRDLHEDMLLLAGRVLPVTAEVIALVTAYVTRGILPAKFQADMTHIALATLAEVDALASWNFKYIVRLEKIRLFNAVNTALGYKSLSISFAQGDNNALKDTKIRAVQMVRRIRDRHARLLQDKTPAENYGFLSGCWRGRHGRGAAAVLLTGFFLLGLRTSRAAGHTT